MAPVPRDDWHALFGTHPHLCVVVEAGDEVDVEGRRRRGLHGANVFAQQLWRREADANGTDAAGLADGDGEVRRQAREGHAGAGEGMTYAEALRETGGYRRDRGHRGRVRPGVRSVTSSHPAVQRRDAQGRRIRGVAASPRSVNAAIGSTCPTSRCGTSVAGQKTKTASPAHAPAAAPSAAPRRRTATGAEWRSAAVKATRTSTPTAAAMARQRRPHGDSAASAATASALVSSGIITVKVA